MFALLSHAERAVATLSSSRHSMLALAGHHPLPDARRCPGWASEDHSAAVATSLIRVFDAAWAAA